MPNTLKVTFIPPIDCPIEQGDLTKGIVKLFSSGFVAKRVLELVLSDEKGGWRCGFDAAYRQTIQASIQIAFQRCRKIFALPFPLEVVILGTASPFVIQAMGGVSGAAVGGTQILLLIGRRHASSSAISYAFAHEYAHLASFLYRRPSRLAAYLVSEGIAEMFAKTVSGCKARFGGSVSRKEAWRVFETIKNRLDSQDHQLRNELFNAAGKYPLWSGYAIGCRAVEGYLKKDKLSWEELFKVSPNKIIDYYGQTR